MSPCCSHRGAWDETRHAHVHRTRTHIPTCYYLQHVSCMHTNLWKMLGAVGSTTVLRTCVGIVVVVLKKKCKFKTVSFNYILHILRVWQQNTNQATAQQQQQQPQRKICGLDMNINTNTSSYDPLSLTSSLSMSMSRSLSSSLRPSIITFPLMLVAGAKVSAWMTVMWLLMFGLFALALGHSEHAGRDRLWVPQQDTKMDRRVMFTSCRRWPRNWVDAIGGLACATMKVENKASAKISVNAECMCVCVSIAVVPCPPWNVTW